MGEGDICGLRNAIEASEGEDLTSSLRASAEAEYARLCDLAGRFATPSKGTLAHYFQAIEGQGWVGHAMNVDRAERLTIKTMVSGHFFFQYHIFLADSNFITPSSVVVEL